MNRDRALTGKASALFSLDLFLNGADAAYRAITIGVMKDGSELDFSRLKAGEVTVLIENLAATITEVVVDFCLHNGKCV